MAETLETLRSGPSPERQFRDEEGDVNFVFVKDVSDAIARSDSALIRDLAGDMHQADLGALIEHIDHDDRSKFIELMGDDFDFAALTEVDDAVREDILDELPNEAIAEGNYADAIYHCYNTFINAAKALLLSKDIQCNTQHGIMNDFDTNFVESQEVVLKEGGFRATVLLINQNEPTEEFAKMYKAEAELFLSNIVAIRSKQVQNA